MHANRLANGAATGKAVVFADDERIGLRASISRADVADFLVRAISEPAISRRAVAIASEKPPGA